MYTVAMIVVWTAIGLTVLDIIAKIFGNNQDNNQEENNNQDNNQDNKTE